MARFILFAGDQYHPLGGARDVAGGWNSIEEAIAAGRACGRDWWNILDVRTGEFYYEAEIAPDEAPEELAKQLAKEAADREERERAKLAEQRRSVEFAEKFNEVTDDPRAALQRRCKLRGHQPVREQGPRRKGAKAFVACACGARLYARTEDGYARVLDPGETTAATTLRKKK